MQLISHTKEHMAAAKEHLIAEKRDIDVQYERNVKQMLVDAKRNQLNVAQREYVVNELKRLEAKRLKQEDALGRHINQIETEFNKKAESGTTGATGVEGASSTGESGATASFDLDADEATLGRVALQVQVVPRAQSPSQAQRGLEKKVKSNLLKMRTRLMRNETQTLSLRLKSLSIKRVHCNKNCCKKQMQLLLKLKKNLVKV